MQTIFDLIKEKVMQCEHEKCMFHIPAEVNYCVVRHEEIEPVGAVLTGDFWRLEKEDNWLEIRYVSKDKCRTFDIRPD